MIRALSHSIISSALCGQFERHRNAKPARRFHIDDQFDFCGELNGQVCRFVTFENFARVDSDLPIVFVFVT